LSPQTFDIYVQKRRVLWHSKYAKIRFRPRRWGSSRLRPPSRLERGHPFSYPISPGTEPSLEKNDHMFLKIVPEMYFWTRKSLLNFGSHLDCGIADSDLIRRDRRSAFSKCYRFRDTMMRHSSNGVYIHRASLMTFVYDMNGWTDFLYWATHTLFLNVHWGSDIKFA